MSRWPLLSLKKPRVEAPDPHGAPLAAEAAMGQTAQVSRIRAPQFGLKFASDYYRDRLLAAATEEAERELPAAK